VRNGYDHPTRLGVDRWVALIGARHRILARGAPRPILVVMVGTAVTVDALDTEGNFLGGLILPGFGLMLRALEMGTAGLKAPTGEAVEFPDQHQRCADERRRRRHRRRGRAHAPQAPQRCGQEPALLMSGGAAVKLQSISDLPFETVETLIFDGLLQLQSKKAAA
jgi:type III pantothenate kinase